MDRRLRLALALSLSLAGAGLAFARLAFADPGSPLVAGRWLADDADHARLLTERQAECIRLPREVERAWQVEIGRAAFRSPHIFGGDAAAVGLSCESCHRNGRGHPQFFFPGLSGQPGTADVTSSLLSAHRGDGIDNPKAIPDLGGPGKGLVVPQARDRPNLRVFLHGAITQEFNGISPSEAVLEGLAEYIRAMKPDFCPRPDTVPITLAADLQDARRAVTAARGAYRRQDPATAVVLVDAARAMLGRIHERYARLPREADLLRASDASLSKARDPAALDAWLKASRGLETELARSQDRSLYDRTVLAQALR